MASINYYYTKSVLENSSLKPEEFKTVLQNAFNVLQPFEIEHLTKWLNKISLSKPELKGYIEEVIYSTKN